MMPRVLLFNPCCFLGRIWEESLNHQWKASGLCRFGAHGCWNFVGSWGASGMESGKEMQEVSLVWIWGVLASDATISSSVGIPAGSVGTALGASILAGEGGLGSGTWERGGWRAFLCCYSDKTSLSVLSKPCKKEESFICRLGTHHLNNIHEGD